MRTQSSLPEEIENYRDQMWCREPELRIESVVAAERFIEHVGFCSALTDSRRPGPSLYIAVCGRRDAYIPRNVQKDPETSFAWTLKDEIIRRGRVYYGRLRGTRTVFVAPRLVPAFKTLVGLYHGTKATVLSDQAKSIMKVLAKEWEMATGDLRAASGIRDRRVFNKAMDELQKALKIMASEVVYEPKFTYIWTLTEARFQKELRMKLTQEQALTEVARAYLQTAGMTLRGELARVTGLPNAEAGLGNWALVDEGFATRLAPGVYRLSKLEPRAMRASASS